MSGVLTLGLRLGFAVKVFEWSGTRNGNYYVALGLAPSGQPKYTAQLLNYPTFCGSRANLLGIWGGPKFKS